MPLTTAEPRNPAMAAGPAPAGMSRLRSTSRSTSRFAVVSLFTLALALPLGACSSFEVEQFIADARSQTTTITDDIGELGGQLAALPDSVRTDVSDAVDNAQAATDEASAALTKAAKAPDSPSTTVALAEAQIALEAASAQVAHVSKLVESTDPSVSSALAELRSHLTELRGETSRAGA